MVNTVKGQSKRLRGLIIQSAIMAGIVCQLLAIWPAHAESGATVPGIPTTPYNLPSDSSLGVTKATSADGGMGCSSGYALSGGSCVLLSTLVPPTECPSGQIASGEACVPASNFVPVVPTCPTGQMLSGTTCIPVIQCPTGLVLSNNQCIPWGTGGLAFCPPQPVETRYVSCPAPQIGSITQRNVGTTCDQATHVWGMSGWMTSNNNCAMPASCPSPSPVTWVEEARMCTASALYYGNPPVPSGGTVPAPSGTSLQVVNNRQGFAGIANATCTNGSWSATGNCQEWIILPNPPPPPPPTPQYGPGPWIYSLWSAEWIALNSGVGFLDSFWTGIGDGSITKVGNYFDMHLAGPDVCIYQGEILWPCFKSGNVEVEPLQCPNQPDPSVTYDATRTFNRWEDFSTSTLAGPGWGPFSAPLVTDCL